MFESFNELVLSAIVLLSGGIICVLVGRLLKLRPLVALALYAWHSMFGFYYARYVLLNGGDAFVYYQRALFEFVELGLGTEFVVWFSSVPVGLGFTYWPLALMFNFIGALGVVLFYAALRETQAAAVNSPFGNGLMVVCALIPSFSFWTSGIGKDSIACLSVGLFLWSTMNFARRQPATIAAIFVMLFVRPHISALMVLSVATGTIFAAELRGSIRFGVASLATAAAIFAVPLALVYSGTTQFASISEYINDRQEQNLGGGSSIDLVGMNPALRFFSFLFRPLPNEAAGFEQFAASLDNLLLIALSAMAVVWIYRAGIGRVFRHHSIALLFGVFSAALLSQVTANLGLATRQKWMLVPALMLVFIGAWGMAKSAAGERRREMRPIFVVPRALP